MCDVHARLTGKRGACQPPINVVLTRKRALIVEMKLYLVLLLLPHLTTSIWLPFVVYFNNVLQESLQVNLDSMFATLKEAAFGETMQEPEEDEPPFVSYAKVGLDFVSQLKKMFTGKMSGEDSKKLANGIRMIFNVTTTGKVIFLIGKHTF